ncbi:hypothetical protein ACEUZ9_000954 [Paracoccus litorisediminis]|uniref:hypothetical protein n=1 Tax=Paracoccus litorisediminis TaxID=2006130 RepID=UPI00372FA570
MGLFDWLPWRRARLLREKRDREVFVDTLLKARTGNEITSLIGLAPIRGRSGPRLFYR